MSRPDRRRRDEIWRGQCERHGAGSIADRHRAGKALSESIPAEIVGISLSGVRLASSLECASAIECS